MKKAAKKTKREPKDVNELAFSIVESLTCEDQPLADSASERKASAGRLGGLKGGKARASKLPAKKRRAIAKKAAKARWVKS